MKTSKLSVTLAKEALEVRKQTAQGWMRRTAPGRTVARMIRGLIDVELADRSMTLAAQEFTSVLPVIILAGAAGNLGAMSESISDQIGVDPQSLTTITHATADIVESSRPTFATFGILGVLMILLSGTSFARALGRVYGKVWEVPTLSVRGWWRWIAVLLAVASAVGLLGRVRKLTSVDWVGPPLAVFGEALVWFALWTVVPYLLTQGRLTGRVLWATAALTSAGLTLVGMAGMVYLPIATESASSKFGELGIVFTAITWMFVQSGVVIAATVVVKALALDEGFIGSVLRGPAPEIERPTEDDTTPATLHEVGRNG